MKDKEININKEKVEETNIIISVKNLLWSFGILVSIASSILGYFHNQAINKINTLQGEVNKIVKVDEEWKDKKFEPLLKETTEMKGDIKVILDRTNNRFNSTNSGGPTNITPESPSN